MDRERPLTEATLWEYALEWSFESRPDETCNKWQQTTAEWSQALKRLTDFSQESIKHRQYTFPSNKEDPNAAYISYTDISKNETGPLSEIRIGIKDNISVAGVPMTCGSPALRDYRPDTDATVVQRILDSGGRVVGKTIMSEFAFGGSRETMRFRLPRNPCDRERYPGGSSSGSAIAVAEGSADAAIGSDTAASIRCPASFCGVIGIKPTPTLISRHGFVGFAPSLDAIGVFSRTMNTGATVLESIAGEDSADPRTTGRQNCEYVQAVEEGAMSPPTEVTVGIPRSLDADSNVLNTVRTSLSKFADAGVTLKRTKIPKIEYALPAWLAIASAEFSMSARAFGHSTPREPVEIAFKEQINQLNEQIQEFLICADYFHRQRDQQYYVLAQRARTQIQNSVQEVLDDVDVLATPTMPTSAPTWDARDSSTQDTNFLAAIANTAPFNVTGNPAVSIPCGHNSGLPIGIQFVGAHFDEARLLYVAAAFEEYVEGASLAVE